MTLPPWFVEMATKVIYPIGIAALTIVCHWAVRWQWSRFRAKNSAYRSLVVLNNRDKDDKINDLLYEMMTAMAADRAMLLKFHNGDRYMDGNPRLRLSCTHERMRSWCQPVLGDWLDTPVSRILPGFLDQVIEQGHASYVVCDMQPSHAHGVLLNQGVNYIMVSIVRNNEQVIIGLLFLGYSQTVQPCQGADQKFRDFTERLNALL